MDRIFREALVERSCTDFVAHTSDVTSVCIGLKSHEIIASGGKDCKVNVWKINPTQEKSNNNVVNMWTFGVRYLATYPFDYLLTYLLTHLHREVKHLLNRCVLMEMNIV